MLLSLKIQSHPTDTIIVQMRNNVVHYEKENNHVQYYYYIITALSIDFNAKFSLLIVGGAFPSSGLSFDQDSITR